MMKLKEATSLLLFSFQVILGKDMRRSPGSFKGLGDTFASFKGPSFFSISEQEFSYPPPDTHKPVYVPQKAAPVQKQAPSYGPSHKCEVKEEKSVARICLPELGSPQCGPVKLQGVQISQTEKCLPITRTVCTEGVDQATVNSCTIKYTPAPVQASATLVDVTYSKDCVEQMVTVCQPGYGGYGYQPKCKELAQETCFNKPSTVPREEEVTLMVPTPSQECGPMQVEIPTITCEEVTEERCVQLPSVEEAEVEAQQCTVDVGGQNCREMELVLPVQVCREQLYGDAHKNSQEYHATR